MKRGSVEVAPKALGLNSITKMDLKDGPVNTRAFKLGYRRRKSVRKGCSSDGHGKHKIS